MISNSKQIVANTRRLMSIKSQVYDAIIPIHAVLHKEGYGRLLQLYH